MNRPVRWSPQVATALIEAAAHARTLAYAPYSRFLVGAALLLSDGTVIPGCNVENASYGLCICAERNAIGTAVGQGALGASRSVVAVAVVTASAPPAAPCGMCRQVLAELAPDARVVLANLAGARVATTVKALLPGGFDAAQLKSGQKARGTQRRGKKAGRA